MPAGVQVVDGSKIGTTAFARVCPVENLDMIYRQREKAGQDPGVPRGELRWWWSEARSAALFAGSSAVGARFPTSLARRQGRRLALLPARDVVIRSG